MNRALLFLVLMGCGSSLPREGDYCTPVSTGRGGPGIDGDEYTNGHCSKPNYMLLCSADNRVGESFCFKCSPIDGGVRCD